MVERNSSVVSLTMFGAMLALIASVLRAPQGSQIVQNEDVAEDVAGQTDPKPLERVDHARRLVDAHLGRPHGTSDSTESSAKSSSAPGETSPAAKPVGDRFELPR